MIPDLTPRRAALGMALSAASILVAVLVLQYAFGAEPCQLCVWQRYPHLVLVLLGVLGFLVWPRAALLAAGTVALGSAGLALYHVGIEQGFWALPAGCTAGHEASSVEELKRLLAEAPPACDQSAFTFLDPLFHGDNILDSGNQNYSEINDPELNELIDTAAATAPGEGQTAAWEEANRYATETAVWIPWSWDESVIIYSPRVLNVYYLGFHSHVDWVNAGIDESAG